MILPDVIWCLNLESRPDRWGAFVDSLESQSRLLAPLNVRRFRATLPADMIVPDYWTGRSPSDYATRVDHLTMIQRSYVEGHQTMLIFEDDAVIQPGFDAAYATIMANLPEGWKGVWFAGDDWRSATFLRDGIVRLVNRTRMHAYLLNRQGMRRVYSHVLHEVNALIDHAVGRLHTMEPHFYGTPHDVVTQSCPDRMKGG